MISSFSFLTRARQGVGLGLWGTAVRCLRQRQQPSRSRRTMKTSRKSVKDICDVCPEKLPNYEVKIKNFFEEYLHTNEEIRYCLVGSGYFDVRDRNDQWIHVAVKKGSMIVLPAGMYHGFTLDRGNYIKKYSVTNRGATKNFRHPDPYVLKAISWGISLAQIFTI